MFECVYLCTFSSVFDWTHVAGLWEMLWCNSLSRDIGMAWNPFKVAYGLPYKFCTQIDGLVQDYNNSIANAQELLQSCTKPSKYSISHAKCARCGCFVSVMLQFPTGYVLCINPHCGVLNSSPPGQNGRRISLKFVPRSPIGNRPTLVQVMACRRIGDTPLPELMLTRFTDAHICGTRGRWITTLW